jgi:quercetin dioxygenase-like cupin family protein
METSGRSIAVSLVARLVLLAITTGGTLAGAAALAGDSDKPRSSAITRAELARHDLSTPGQEVIQVLVEFGPGAAFGAHTHPGEELAYVLKGSLEYEVAGRPTVRLGAGEVLFIPAGTVHSARNVGDTPASELATYVVAKGRPLVEKR